MIVNKTAYGVNDIVEFQYVIPLRGLSSITNFLDDITGEIGTRYFEKKFSYTKDGLTWTDFQPLTNLNLQAITIDLKDDFILRFKYIRRGTLTTGTLVVNQIIINGVYNLSYLQVFSTYGTVFAPVAFTDLYWNKLWLNLLQKLYGIGILPEYMKRGEDYPDFDDSHFILYWKIQAYFFALIGALNDRKVTNFFSDPENVFAYLGQKNFFLCGDEDITVLTYYLNNFYAEIVKRGTEGVYLEDGDWLNQVAMPKHGEVRRMICYEYKDEFLYNLARSEQTAWYIGLNSPQYTGNDQMTMIDKTADQGGDFTDLADYENIVLTTLATDGDKEVFAVALNGGFSTKKIKVDPLLGYEISFQIDATNQISFDVYLEGFDEEDNAVDFTKHQSPNATENNLLTNFAPASSEYTFVRLFIHPYNSNSSVASQSNMLQDSLRFDESHCYLRIHFENGATGKTANIWDLRFRPMIVPNTAYINSMAVVQLWMRNRNTSVSTFNILNKTRRYIIPYNALLQLITLDREPEFSSNEPQAWLMPDGQPWLLPDGEPWLLPIGPTPPAATEQQWLLPDGEPWLLPDGEPWLLP